MLINNRKALSCAGGIVAAGFLFCVVIVNRGTGLVSLEDDADEPKDYYITAFPPGARKGVGDKNVNLDSKCKGSLDVLNFNNFEYRTWAELWRSSSEQVQ